MSNLSRLESLMLPNYMMNGVIGQYDKSDPIYHYTSPSGLIGILKKDNPVLFFSRYDSLNDKTEGTHILELYKRACENLLESKRIEKDFYDAIIDLEISKEQFFTYRDEEYGVNHSKLEKVERYICCFSKERDSLPMWNYYAKDGRCEGYNIGFSFFGYRHKHCPNICANKCALDICSVLYDNQYKCNLLE